MILLDSLKTYWNKGDTFLLPLTGIKNNPEFIPSTYLFWRNISIENYHFIVTFDEDENLDSYLSKFYSSNIDDKSYICPINEIYSIMDRRIFIFDLSKWSTDVDYILNAKYSKLSSMAKALIQEYHIMPGRVIPQHIFAALFPNTKTSAFNDKTSIEMICELLGLDDPESVTDIGGFYDKNAETLLTEVDFSPKV